MKKWNCRDIAKRLTIKGPENIITKISVLFPKKKKSFITLTAIYLLSVVYKLDYSAAIQELFSFPRLKYKKDKNPYK